MKLLVHIGYSIDPAPGWAKADTNITSHESLQNYTSLQDLDQLHTNPPSLSLLVYWFQPFLDCLVVPKTVLV